MKHIFMQVFDMYLLCCKLSLQIETIHCCRWLFNLGYHNL